MYKVCDNCSELFLESEEWQYFDNFGFVCVLCLDEGFEVPTPEFFSQEAKVIESTSSQKFQNLIQLDVEKT